MANLRHFKVKGVNPQTGRSKSLNIKSRNETTLCHDIQNYSINPPFEITEIPTPPTQAQLDFAKVLQITVPETATLKDVSAMIDKKKSRDPDPKPGLIDYANEMGLVFSDYIGKKALYNSIFDQLKRRDLIAFFTFCVYRHLTDDREANLNKSEHKQTIYDFAESKINNDKFVKSLFNYTGAQIRFFGKIVFTDGGEMQGGSTNTIAYKETAEFISSKFNTPKTKTVYISGKINETKNLKEKYNYHLSSNPEVKKIFTLYKRLNKKILDMKKTFKFLLYGFIAIIGIGVIASAFGSDDKISTASESQSSAPVAEKKQEPQISITSEDLAREYSDNEVAADNKYKGKTVELTGKILEIAKDFTDDAYIVLPGSNEYSADQVHCSLKNNNDIASFKKGQNITIIGIVDGSIMGSPMVKKCFIK